MKKQIILLSAMAIISSSALAQSTSTQTKLDQTMTTGAKDTGVITSTASNLNASGENAIAPSIKYTGFMYGPGLEFSASKQSTNNGQSNMSVHSRTKLLAKSGKKFEAGIETRFDTAFTPEGLKATNSNYRLLANFKNVFETDTLGISFIPRISLPTSNKAHDQKMRPSPEFLTTFDFNPKNTRFSLNGGMAFFYGLYEDNSAANATTFLYQPWVELDYQLSPDIKLMTAYWPEFTAQGHSNRPLAGDSHEIDLGLNWDFIKGWTLIPYIALEAYSLADVSTPLKNMQANLIVTGSVF